MLSVSTMFTRGHYLALLLLVLGLALRIWDINARALWFDEASEYWVATAPLSALPAAVRDATGDPPLYSFLLHVWTRLGTGEIWMRSLSVLFSVAGLAGAMVFARALGGWSAGAAAGVLIALNPADVRYAQDAGQYALMPAAIVWSLVALDRIVRGGGWRWILVWTASALAASYLYYGAVFSVMVPFACVVAESVFARDLRRRRTTGTALVLYVAGVLPLLVYFLPAQLGRVVASGDAGAGGAAVSGAAAAWRWLCEMLAFQFTGWPYTRVPAVIPIAAAGLLLFLAVRAQRRVAIWLAATWVVYGAADAAGVFPHGYRWGMILFPLLVTVMSAGVAASKISRRAAPIALVALTTLILASVVSLPNRSLRDRFHGHEKWPWPETEDMRVVVRHWREQRTEAQPTYVYYGAAPAFAYYTRDMAPREGLPPTWHLACWHDETTPGFCRANSIYYGRWLRRFDTAQKVNSVFSSFGGRPAEFWIVFGHIAPTDDRDMLAALLQQGYRIGSAVQAKDAAAFLLTRP